MREAVPLPLVVQVVPKQEAPELVIRMYGHCRLAVLEDGPALVRPGEYASGEVADVGNAGRSQSLDDGRASIADRAIDHDGGASIDRKRHEATLTRLDSDGTAKMTHGELFLTPHVEECDVRDQAGRFSLG
jgi:hypothetical protein